ncbi:GumC family protein [Alteriqipengyuania sp. 357]
MTQEFDPREPTLAESAAATPGEGGAGTAAPMLWQYVAIFLRRKWVILAVTALAVLIGLAVTLMTPPQYTAASRIEISRNQQRITNVEGVEQSDRTFDTEFYETQYELLRTRSVAERVVRDLRLANSTEFFVAHGIEPGGADWLSADPDQPITRETLDKRREVATGLLLGNIAVAPIARSALVDIAYTSQNPTISAQVANSWAEQFMADSMDRRFESTDDAREFLEGRLEELRQRVEESQSQLVNYANERGIVVLDRVERDGRTVSSPTLVAQNLQAANAALATASEDRIQQEARASAVRNNNTDLVNNPAISNLRQRRADLRADYARLMAQFEPGYPPAEALQRQINNLDQAIAQEEGRVRQSAQADYQAALQREQTLQARVDELTQQLSNQERDRIQYAIYQNEVDTNRELYDGLLQRYKEIGVAGVAANNISLVDPAQIPKGPSSPNLILNLLIALVGGIALSGVAVFILEQFDEGLKSPNDVKLVTGLPLLGAIPAIGEEENPVDLVTDPKTEISEAYLTVRSNLAFSTTAGVPGTLMVTSTRPAEGKSTTSFAIANVLARTGKRVLLVDADMRSPSLHAFFDMENGAGFSDCLSSQAEIASVIRRTEIENLSFLSAGRTPPSAAELLSSDRPRELIDTLAAQFDHVVIDAPPLLGIADATLLSRAVSALVYVVEANGAPGRAINNSLDRLRTSDVPILGIVFTKFSGQAIDSYGYGYGYGYGLKYGAEPEEA